MLLPGQAGSPILDVQGLTLHISTARGELRAVQDVSFSAHREEVVAIVGESGAGKSVTALSLMRLMPSPPARFVGGTICLNGRDLLKLSPAQMREVRGNEMSMIFQEPMTALNPALRLWRQIAEPLVRHRNMGWRQARRRAVELLAEVQIPDPELGSTAYPHQFSGGMRQRVMIAMAIACNARLIVADEPTTALDVTVQAQVLSLLTRLIRDIGGALVLITHDLGLVARYADFVNVMYAGRIVECASVDDLYRVACHPYTRGLMASIPRIAGPLAQRLEAIPGQSPSIFEDARGCAFAPRCNRVISKCRTEKPPLEAISTRHRYACWNP